MPCESNSWATQHGFAPGPSASWPRASVLPKAPSMCNPKRQRGQPVDQSSLTLRVMIDSGEIPALSFMLQGPQHPVIQFVAVLKQLG